MTELDLPRIPSICRWKISETQLGISVKLQRKTWFGIWVNFRERSLFLRGDDDAGFSASEAAHEIMNSYNAEVRHRNQISRITGTYQEATHD